MRIEKHLASGTQTAPRVSSPSPSSLTQRGGGSRGGVADGAKGGKPGKNVADPARGGGFGWGKIEGNGRLVVCLT